MRKNVLLIFLILTLLCCAARAEDTPRESLLAFLKETYAPQGWTVACAQCEGNTGAAIISRREADMLVVLDRASGAWQVTLENSGMLERRYGNEQQPVVRLSGERELTIVYTIEDWNAWSQQRTYRCRDGAWLLDNALAVYPFETDYGQYQNKYQTMVLADQVITTHTITDAKGNVLCTWRLDCLPNVLKAEEIDLRWETWDACCVSHDGYQRDESNDVKKEIVRRLFGALAITQNQYVSGYCERGSMVFLTERPTGERTLLCLTQEDEGVWVQVESTPLPAGATMGYENFTTAILVNGCAYAISPRPDREWGISCMEAPEFVQIGPNWASEWFELEETVIGDHPWGDITKLDWATLPQTKADILQAMDASHWATPNNPDPNDRLNLRASPDKKSPSLGRYYNGTPVYVLSREGDWCRVRIGDTTGYMMTKYLAFGEAAQQVPRQLQHKFPVNPVTAVIWTTGGAAIHDNLNMDDVDALRIIGIDGDEWYIVWDYITGRYGRVRQYALWDGNG